MTAGTTERTTAKPAARRTLTPLERRRSRYTPGELARIDWEGQLLEQLEAAQTMLAVAVGLLVQVSGKERGFVVWSLGQAAKLIPAETE